MKKPFFDYIATKICHSPHQWLSFSDYMSLALYHSRWGYYNQSQLDIGNSATTFTTAPHITPLFARTIAQACETIWQRFWHQQPRHFIEFGAGSGQFAHDFILSLKAKDALPDTYTIIELSETLQAKQKTFLRQSHPDYFAHFRWVESIPVNYDGIIFANEVLDALPVHCFEIGDGQIDELGVGLTNQSGCDELIWCKRPITAACALGEAVYSLQQRVNLQNSGYRSEISLAVPAFIQNISAMTKRGLILLFDYGYGETEYYHPARDAGSLTTLYKGQTLNNPLLHPGEQDITAHVNFTQVAEAAVTCGCDLLGYTTQASYLLDAGILNVAQDHASHSAIDEYESHQALKYLTFPTEMGERIKTMALGIGLGEEAKLAALPGFNFKDNRREL